MNRKKNPFKVTTEEYLLLEKEFGKLCKFQGWQLLRKNTKNNHTNEFEDISQDLSMHLIIAGMYFKRQVWIESALQAVTDYAADPLIRGIIVELAQLWANRKRHGANRQKFGPFQEKILDQIVNTIVPKRKRPRKDATLIIDAQFGKYCKAITWNCLKNIGKKITKEKSIRASAVSLNEYDYLATSDI
jgi:hypothetical protein